MYIICVITDVDSVLLRMTIIGVLLSFRQLAQEALIDVSMIKKKTVFVLIFCYLIVFFLGKTLKTECLNEFQKLTFQVTSDKKFSNPQYFFFEF